MSRCVARALFFWALISFGAWNGFFDLRVHRGEQEYFAARARHELGLGPAVTMDQVMGEAQRDGVLIATIWAGAVFVAGAACIAYVRRATVRECRDRGLESNRGR